MHTASGFRDGLIHHIIMWKYKFAEFAITFTFTFMFMLFYFKPTKST